jgi:hypothetical protein
MLNQCPAGLTVAYEVNIRVNSVRNNNPSLIERVLKSLILWRSLLDSNPCYSLERSKTLALWRIAIRVPPGVTC